MNKFLIYGTIIAILFLVGFWLSKFSPGNSNYLLLPSPLSSTAATPTVSPLPQFTPTATNVFNRSCSLDTDCILVDTTLADICCGGDNCEPLDFSQDKWVAVNASGYAKQKDSVCTVRGVCAPGKECFPKPINDAYHVQCSNNSCLKVRN